MTLNTSKSHLGVTRSTILPLVDFTSLSHSDFLKVLEKLDKIKSCDYMRAVTKYFCLQLPRNFLMHTTKLISRRLMSCHWLIPGSLTQLTCITWQHAHRQRRLFTGSNKPYSWPRLIYYKLYDKEPLSMTTITTLPLQESSKNC